MTDPANLSPVLVDYCEGVRLHASQAAGIIADHVSEGTPAEEILAVFRVVAVELRGLDETGRAAFVSRLASALEGAQ